MPAHYQQLYNELKQAISAGYYLPGQRLPSSRTLALEKGLSRNTIVRAFEMLVSEGYLIGCPGDGMRVPTDLPEVPWTQQKPTNNAKDSAITLEPIWSDWSNRLMSSSKMPVSREKTLSHTEQTISNINFQYGFVDMGEQTQSIWRKLAAKWSRLQSQHYGNPQGLKALRQALARHINTYRGCYSNADNLVIANSAQQLFTSIVALVTQPGDYVVIEEPWYHRFKSVLELANVKAIAVTTDTEGLNIDSLNRLTIEQGIIPTLVYVTPSHQFPSGVVMSLQRRLALLQWCNSHNVWIIEDDYDSEFRYQGQPIDALQSLDANGRVLYIGTTAKTLCPSLRLAYGIFPAPWVGRVSNAIWQTSRHASWLEQHMLAELIEQGGFASHIRRQRRLYASNRQCLVETLNRVFGNTITIQGDKAGLHLLIWLPRPVSDEQQILKALAVQGVIIYPISHWYNKPPEKLGFLMGYASLTHDDIQRGVTILHKVLTTKPTTRGQVDDIMTNS